MGWLAAGDGYEIALVEGRVTARSTAGRSAGRQLKTLPKAVREHPETERLRRFATWLDRHAASCRDQVDAWMVSSVPVPTGLLGKVWQDEAWQAALRDLVAVGDGEDEVGFLRDATPEGELRLVNLDGETVRISPATVTLPHPVLLEDLEDLREFAAELGVVQGVEQLHRATWLRTEEPEERATEVQDFAGGKFGSRFALAARAASLGYRVTGGYATARVLDGTRTVEPAVWIGEPWYYGDSETGALCWRDAEGRALTLREVGPVAWSEGMRMAAALYAGRTVTEGKSE